jgi:hypothetical protein
MCVDTLLPIMKNFNLVPGETPPTIQALIIFAFNHAQKEKDKDPSRRMRNRGIISIPLAEELKKGYSVRLEDNGWGIPFSDWTDNMWKQTAQIVFSLYHAKRRETNKKNRKIQKEGE